MPPESLLTAQLTENQSSGMPADLLRQQFEHHLRYTLAKDLYTATDDDRYRALALTVRDDRRGSRETAL